MSKHKSEDYKISAVNYYLDYAYNKSKSYKQKTKKVNKKIYK